MLISPIGPFNPLLTWWSFTASHRAEAPGPGPALSEQKALAGVLRRCRLSFGEGSSPALLQIFSKNRGSYNPQPNFGCKTGIPFFEKRSFPFENWTVRLRHLSSRPGDCPRLCIGNLCPGNLPYSGCFCLVFPYCQTSIFLR